MGRCGPKVNPCIFKMEKQTEELVREMLQARTRFFVAFFEDGERSLRPKNAVASRSWKEIVYSKKIGSLALEPQKN